MDFLTLTLEKKRGRIIKINIIKEEEFI